MTKKIGLIIKIPTKKVSKEEIEYRKTKFYDLLAWWYVKEYFKDNDDVIKYLEGTRTRKMQQIEIFSPNE